MLFSSTPMDLRVSMTLLTISVFFFWASSEVASSVTTAKDAEALSGTRVTVPDADTVISALDAASSVWAGFSTSAADTVNA